MIAIVGIGADGWPGLGEPARDALRAAPTVIGSERQLALLPTEVPGERRAWPSPIDPLVDALAAGRHDGAAVLASGDPMLHGIGSSLARRGVELAVHPHASAVAYACARLGWPEAEVDLVNIVGRSPDTLARVLQPRRRVVVFGNAASAAAVLVDRGYGPSRFVVLEQLGGPNERLTEGTADSLGDRAVDPLHAVAIECVAAEGTPLLPRVPGLPDEAYDTDGALTKRSVRAATLAALAPLPRALLWDVGAGSGSIGIEWMRAHPSRQAVAIESHAERQRFIEHNRDALGVPGLQLVAGRAPDALAGLAAPDAIFIGGGASAPGVLDACWSALKPGGRLVANAVTLQGELALAAWRDAHGGTLTRVSLAHAEPLGRFDTGRQPLPVTLYDGRKPDPAATEFTGPA